MAQDQWVLTLAVTADDLERVSFDHCPFRFDDAEGKLNSKGKTRFRWMPNGTPGDGTRPPILCSEGVMKGRIDLPRFAAPTATNNAKLYGLYPQKGTIAVGSDADLSLWDPKATRTIRNDALHHGAHYTPYEGLNVKAWPITVFFSWRGSCGKRRFASTPRCGTLPLPQTQPKFGSGCWLSFAIRKLSFSSARP